MTEVVYAISIKEKLVYIGRTNNFRRRQNEHMRNIYKGTGARKFRKAFQQVRMKSQWNDIEFTIVYDGTGKQVKKKERELIMKHRPIGNTEFLDGFKYWKRKTVNKNTRRRPLNRSYHFRYKPRSNTTRTPCL